MSRIEKSLEKAIEMRESLQKGNGGASAKSLAAAGADIAKLRPGEPVVDIEGVDKRIICIREPDSIAAEQYKKLRAKILRATGPDFLNAIMVTSPHVSEGKTVTALNVAVSIAREIDRTVLLVDADLRNPTVHRYLGMEPGGGLSDYLKGEAKLPDVLVKTGIGRLVVLPAGTQSDNPSELLSSDRMRALVKELKDRYKDRYIIFDSSPLLVTADPISLGGFMDGVLLVLQFARTGPKEARKALSLLKGCRVLGAVFNNVPGRLTRQFYPYYYGHYGKAYAPRETKGGK